MTTTPIQYRHILFDWGDTLMRDLPGQTGPMADWPKVEAMPGAVQALHLLSAHSVCHLATNARDSDAQDIRRALARVGLDNYLQQIFCYRQLQVEKPARAYFQQIVETLHCPSKQILMVGDNLQKDVAGALDAGLDACWLNLKEEGNHLDIQQVNSFSSLTSWLLSGLNSHKGTR
ncbi:HAD family hydrolase [Bowmanella pacifica]|uniref:Hydrolase of the HAD superfamily n=1 Tax=Bowmanella pacifica TaxID=502051 RepID=A0A917Z288_9ALTE|nr:HAD-IA family hydrolase [Bowmanella pacifica]GGO73078.1 hypothetical protein GCM10010982_32770 [Bowmanella pacifica]